MFSKITQPMLKNFPSNNSLYDAKSIIYGGSGKSLSLESYGFSNKCLLFVLMGKGILGGQQCYRMYLSHQHNTTRVFDNLLWVKAFTKDIFISVMASNTVNGLWFYKPLITLEAI